MIVKRNRIKIKFIISIPLAKQLSVDEKQNRFAFIQHIVHG